MKIERVRAGDWEWVREFLLARLESIGCGMTEREVPVFEGLLRDEANWFVRCEGLGLSGLVVFKAVGPRRYEVHACVDRKSWGWRWVGAIRKVLDWFRREAEVERLWTYVPVSEEKSLVLARVLRFRKMWKGAVTSGEMGAGSRERGVGQGRLVPVWWFELKGIQ